MQIYASGALTNERPNDRTTERPNDRTTDQPNERPNDRTNNRTTDLPTDRPNRRMSGDVSIFPDASPASTPKHSNQPITPNSRTPKASTPRPTQTTPNSQRPAQLLTPKHPHHLSTLIKPKSFDIVEPHKHANQAHKIQVQRRNGDPMNPTSHLVSITANRLMRITFDCILTDEITERKDIEPIVEYIVKTNTANNVTGTMTFFHDAANHCCVSQIIEGNVEHIKRLFGRISADSRVSVISGSHSTLIRCRDYIDWTVVVVDEDETATTYSDSGLQTEITEMKTIDCGPDTDTHFSGDYTKLCILQQSECKIVFVVKSTKYPEKKFVMKEITSNVYSMTEYDILKQMASHTSPFIQDIPDMFACDLRTSMVFKMYELDLYALMDAKYVEANVRANDACAANDKNTPCPNALQFTPEIIQCYSAILVKIALHLEHHNIVHCDIKDENIFIDSMGRMVLADFECAFSTKLRTNRPKGIVGTPIYFAPEILRGCRYSHASDLWALGVVMCGLTSCEMPWDEMDMCHGNGGEMKRMHTALVYRPPFLPPAKFSPPKIDMLQKIFKGIDSRISAAELRDHDFFNGYNWVDPEYIDILRPIREYIADHGLTTTSHGLENDNHKKVDEILRRTTYRMKSSTNIQPTESADEKRATKRRTRRTRGSFSDRESFERIFQTN